MNYYIETTLNTDFDSAVEKTKEALSEQGFGVLSEIDIHEKLKAKLGVDFRKYKILGACNPPNAYKALEQENKIGTMLPCNVIVQDLQGGKVEVAAVDPVASMMAVENDKLAPIAQEIRELLKKAIQAL
ncbi:DUF302 domain-containing protein [Marinilabilia rubra]|uniref:DUF302 domain-containing protein n=1 Tax=Marinilabilia rubra TaxID=2162893 RepID=A0A2U2B5L3_9BACT|nr:DUF302 domain-containing protein [Marinilabilia rubra]PWD98357.1 hypothetical protein DDZ16_15620 [Marinilabilia rubra]